MIRRLQPWVLLGAGLLAMPVSVLAAAGQVMFTSGEVTAERQPPVTLLKGDEVFVADTVRTGTAARAQLLLQDGARLAIRPDSAVRIEEYVYQAATRSAAPVTSRSANRSVTRLLKGGFRTVTGAIGKDDEKAYEVRTPVGVLGIRGTDYMAVFCNADCRPSGSGTVPAEDGLYLGVVNGVIVFSNEAGDLELRAGEHAFVPLDTRRPRRLAVPPPVFFDELERPLDAQLRASRVGFDSTLGSRRQPDVDAAPNQDSETNDTGMERADAPKQPVFGSDADGNRIDLLPGQIEDGRSTPGNNTDMNQ
ncbi:MAG: FecR family protein [Woeseia sp.]